MSRILLIEICDYKEYPLGGHLSFAKNLLLAFGNELALVGCSTDEETPVGKWIKKDIDGVEYDFFSVKKVKVNSFEKSIIPSRIKDFISVSKYRKQIFDQNVDNVIIQTPEVLFATKKHWKGKNIALFLPGIENPFSFSRYNYASFFAKAYDNYFFKHLKCIDSIFACADQDAIIRMSNRSKGLITPDKIISFPTRVDTDVFYPTQNKNKEKENCNLPQNEVAIVCSGRLHWEKGWSFLIDSFEQFHLGMPNSKLYFIGDGNEKEIIQTYIEQKNLQDFVILKGLLNKEELSSFLRAADLFVMGSYAEGWSTTLLEAVATGIPACVTLFSSATTLVHDGVNGYVCKDRNEHEFAKLMECSLSLSIEKLESSAQRIKNTYSMSRMKEDLLSYWELY